LSGNTAVPLQAFGCRSGRFQKCRAVCRVHTASCCPVPGARVFPCRAPSQAPARVPVCAPSPAGTPSVTVHPAPDSPVRNTRFPAPERILSILPHILIILLRTADRHRHALVEIRYIPWQRESAMMKDCYKLILVPDRTPACEVRQPRPCPDFATTMRLQ